ncbi:P-loop containing nucleoside triphosphate hydrolase protein [Cadophora sp. DSE1049]|nr:P-loop containing nucleoside triphosphate hydrolase protein [Cadophora sp. DSE1049]
MKPEIDPSQDPTDEESSEFDDIEHIEPLQNGAVKQLKCEVKEYEERMNLKGELIMKEIEERHAVDEKIEGQDYAMKSYKRYGRDGGLESSRLEIQSPYLKDALRAVVKQYPGVSFRGDTIILHGILRCIFHYRKELEEYRQKIGDRYAKLHVHLLLRFMEKELRSSIRGYEANVGTSIPSPAIEYKDLWMVFLPGESVVTGQDEMNQMLSLVSTNLIEANCGSFWRITGRCFTHDGTRFGYAHKHINIQPYEGTKTIRDFPILPLRYYDTETVIQRLQQMHISRGKKFCSLKGHHYRSYTGRAFAVSDKWDEREDGLPRPPLPPGAPYSKFKINSRVVVDCKTFGESKSPNRVWLNDRKPLWTKLDEEEIDVISDEDFMICDSQVPGFSLFDKKWCFFAVDFIKDVDFNDAAFQQLLLPKNHKEVVHALVKNHGSDDFDDLIKGKGKGLVFVLHGVPGVGKTFTAESIADDVRKPLYVVNSGELGVTPYEVEMHLNSALRLATHWGAIVLIDEADVFLEQRTIHDLTRNCLVSLFLRILEYYEGILFLTTNRLTSFDLAFKSRIHLALKYTALDHHRRKELWKLFIGRSTKETSEVWDDAVLADLARVDINGRQIKNSVRTASTLARSMNMVLAKEHIDIVLGTIDSFEADLNEDTQDVVALRD